MAASESKLPKDRKDRARYGAVFLEYARQISPKKCNRYLRSIGQRTAAKRTAK